jgi:hydroxymethylpyrimidine/phosphomethylpyrimidine kinase
MTADTMATQNDRRSQSPATAVALSIAGSDSSAGAGIQADLKTFTALGVYGLTAVTCVVAETPGKVARIEPMTAEIVREQIAVVVKSFPIRAIKTGLLCTAEIVTAVANAIVDLARKIPLVVDPVMIATSGDALLAPDAVEAYEKELFPLARLITPNLDEAAKLLGETIQDRQSMARAARALAEKYRTNVLLKGGHLPGHDAVDLLYAEGKITEFSAPFVTGVATHGTGCTYSAAIVAGLARGDSLEMSIKRAKEFVTQSIRDHLAWGDVHALKHFPSDANA